MEFVSVESKTFGRLPYLRRVVNVRKKACTEGGRVLDVPTLGGCAAGSRLETDRPLRGRAATDHYKLNCQLTNL